MALPNITADRGALGMEGHLIRTVSLAPDFLYL